MVRKQSPKPGVAGTGPGQLIAITSGKGGVGKTNVVVNLALALTRAKQRVAIFDADFGLANVDVVLGLAPTYHMGHVIEGILPLREIILEGPEGVHIIPASSGIQDLAVMSQAQRDELVFQLDQVLSSYDYIFIDTAAGISDNVIRFLMAAPRVVVVCAPEPTAIVDAYALIKVLFRRSPSKDVLVLVNLVEGRMVCRNSFRGCPESDHESVGASGRQLQEQQGSPDCSSGTGIPDRAPFDGTLVNAGLHSQGW